MVVSAPVKDPEPVLNIVYGVNNVSSILKLELIKAAGCVKPCQSCP